MRRPLRINKTLTDRNDTTLQTYLQEIKKIALLTPEEEIQLMSLIRLWNKSAKDRLINANLRFVVSVAKQYEGKYKKDTTLMDIINEGSLWLITAAERFDETRGFKFISYAVWRIRQSIESFLYNEWKTVRLPLNKMSMANKIKKIEEELEQALERLPTEEEIKESLKNNHWISIGDFEVNNLVGNYKSSLSLDMPLGDDAETTFADTIREKTSTDANLLQESLQIEIERVLQTLKKPRDAEIIRLYFGLNNQRVHSLKEIANILDLTEERVRQIKEKSIEQLKKILEDDSILKTYL